MFKKILLTFFVCALGISFNFYAMSLSSSALTRTEEVVRENALKTLKISAWNKAYKTGDKSIISSINGLIGTIAINDEKNKKKIIMQIGKLPEDWKEAIPEKLNYHPRIDQWSQGSIELLDVNVNYDKMEKDSINNHCFPEMVDYIIQKFGTRGIYTDKNGLDKPQLTMVGRIEHKDASGSVVSGKFEYTFFEDADGVKTLYHRFFRPHKFNYKTLYNKK